jgi:hypothetical protein
MRLAFFATVVALMATSAIAQTTQPSIPISVDILVLPPGTTDLTAPTATPVAVRNTPISATGAMCGRPDSGAGSSTSLVNPTAVAFDDPFTVGRECIVPLPVGLPVGTGYRAVAIFRSAPCSDTNGNPLPECVSPRSLLAVPPFNVQSILTRPAAPTTLVVKP